MAVKKGMLLVILFCCFGIAVHSDCVVWQDNFETFTIGQHGLVPSGGYGCAVTADGDWKEAQWGEGWVGIYMDRAPGKGKTGDNAFSMNLSVNQQRTPCIFRSFDLVSDATYTAKVWCKYTTTEPLESYIFMGVGWYDYPGTGTNQKSCPSLDHSYSLFRSDSVEDTWYQASISKRPNTDPDTPAFFIICSGNAMFGELTYYFDDFEIVKEGDSTDCCACSGTGSLKNADFEGGFESDGTAKDWDSFVLAGSSTLDFLRESNASWLHGGASSQRFWDGGSAYDAGLMQTVCTETPGIYTFGAWMHAFRADSGKVTLYAGADLTGKTNSGVVNWGTPTENPTEWTQVSIAINPTGDFTTFFLRSKTDLPVYGERSSFLDDAFLNYAPGQLPTNTPASHCPNSCGDCNCDGNVTPGDALLAFNLFLGINPAGTVCGGNISCIRWSADSNADNNVTPGDALVIFNAFLGIGNPNCRSL